MINALVDRDSSQIDRKPPENAGAGSNNRTRRRERDEAPEDYAKSDDFKAARGTRERLQSAATVGITTHFFSVVYYALINVTRDIALKPIQTTVPRVYVFGQHAACDDELRSRIELYDRGVNPELFVNLRNPICWVPYNDQYLVCPTVGEVMSISSWQLLGHLHSDKIHMSDGTSRAHMILHKCKGAPADGETADHKLWHQPLNDSIDNLRWATGEKQRSNQRPVPFFFFFHTEKSGKELPVHKILGHIFRCTSAGQFSIIKLRNGKSKTGAWLPWSYPHNSTGEKRAHVKLMGKKRPMHSLMMECLLQRNIMIDETVDHIDGDYYNNTVRNLQLATQRSNSEKSRVRLVTSSSANKNVVFGGSAIAAADLGIYNGNIVHCIAKRLQTTGGYSWRDSTVEEVEHFFRAMDALEDLPAAVASLASHPRHGELVRALELRREREAALARLGLCDPPVGWVRGTDASSGLSFYHREETGECRWRNPTLTRLGL